MKVNNEEKITELTKAWYQMIRGEAYKDKDHSFYITKIWSYGQKPYYKVNHDVGYWVHGFVREFSTYEEAEQFLCDCLTEHIETLRTWAEKIIKKENAHPGDIKRANKILKVLEELGGRI